MRRHAITARPDWLSKVESQGLVYAHSYWDETAYYEFSLAEVEALEEVVEELHRMCLEAVDHVIATDRFADYGITDKRVQRLIVESRDEPELYGRFDLRYDGDGNAKLLEYNADTPTSLVEAASAQWFWLEELFGADDQWNSLHERLVDAWRKRPLLDFVHFAYTEEDYSGEDFMTTAYLAETASQAGLRTHVLPIEAIGWDRLRARFVDDTDRTISAIFKLYPWEWLVGDKFGGHVKPGHNPLWIEPAWKMLLSNKALLALLWEMFPGHPNLLPAYLDGPRELAFGYVAKPLLGREGAGILINQPAGPGHCYQAFYPLPEFDGNRPVIGAWTVCGEAAGMGIRESTGLITDLGARFVPHVIRG
ncbi:MAG TPA: glutathionylspermidine synthase family protein [Candidatus Limnocylindrales bacterium]